MVLVSFLLPDRIWTVLLVLFVANSSFFVKGQNNTCDALLELVKAGGVDPEEDIVGEYFYDPDALSCSCEKNEASGVFSLACSFCKLCDPTGICARRFQKSEFDANGIFIRFEETVTYIKGREEQLFLTSWWDNAGYKCSVNVDGVECQSCSFQPCAAKGGEDHLLLNCSNVPDGDTIDRCVEDATKSNPHDGVFTIINDNIVCDKNSDVVTEANDSDTDNVSNGLSISKPGRPLTVLFGAILLLFTHIPLV